jgi:hypothetical protein
MKAELLTQEFASDAVPNADGRLLLDPGDTLALISRATEEGVPILGVRGVRVAADRAGPAAGSAAGSAAEHAADYAAGVAGGHGCWVDADAFVRARRGQGLAFELTLGDDPIEAV